jgi:hypothetical protein
MDPDFTISVSDAAVHVHYKPWTMIYSNEDFDRVSRLSSDLLATGKLNYQQCLTLANVAIKTANQNSVKHDPTMSHMMMFSNDSGK